MTMLTALKSLLNRANTEERTFLINRDRSVMKKSTIAIIGLVIAIAIVAIGLTAYFLCSNRSITELRPRILVVGGIGPEGPITKTELWPKSESRCVLPDFPQKVWHSVGQMLSLPRASVDALDPHGNCKSICLCSTDQPQPNTHHWWR